MVARMTIEGNAAIYRAALDSANAGDLAGYLDLYSDDVVFGGVTPEPLDKAGVVAAGSVAPTSTRLTLTPL
jgi:ketosteroid isomerase-like protein